MEKKETFRVISLILALAGFFLALNSQVKITGAVLGLFPGSYSLSLILGIILIAVAGVLFVWAERGRGLDELVSMEEFIEKIKKKNPDEVVMDTSVFLGYESGKVETMLRQKSWRTLVPETVLNELSKGSYLQNTVKGLSQSVPGFEKYRTLSEQYLEKTTKNRFIKILNKEMSAPTSRREIEDYKKITKGLCIRLSNKGQSPSVPNLLREAEQSGFPVSQADIDVVATAIYEAAHHKHIIVAEKDSHLSEAIEMIQKDYPEIGEYIVDMTPLREKLAPERIKYR